MNQAFLSCLFAVAVTVAAQALPAPNPTPPGNLLDSQVVEKVDNKGNKASLRLQISSYSHVGTDAKGQKVNVTTIEAALVDVRLRKKHLITGSLTDQHATVPVSWNITYRTPRTFPPPNPANGSTMIQTGPGSRAKIFSRTGTGAVAEIHGSVTLQTNGFPPVVITF